MKRTSSIIIVLTTILTILFGFYYSQQAAEQPAELKPSKSTVKRGETFIVSLTVNNNPKNVGGIFGYEDDLGFKIKYDPNKLELTKGENINSTDWNSGSGKGTIALMMDKTVEEVYKFTFKVKDNAEYGSTRIETTDLNVLFDDGSELNNVKTGVEINIQEQQTPTPTPTNEVSNQTQNEVTNEVQNQTTNETQNEISNQTQNQTTNETPANNTVKPIQNTIPAQNNNIKNGTNTTNIVDRDPTTAKKEIPYTGVTYTILISAMVMAIVAGIIRIVIKYYDKQ